MTKALNNLELSAAIADRATVIAVALKMLCVPSDAVSACAMLSLGLSGLRHHNIPTSEVRGYTEQLTVAIEKAPLGGLSVDAALADAKAHAAKAGYSANGDPL